MRVLFFIPTYNDRHGLEPLVAELLQAVPDSQVLVVDDGSDPEIALRLEEPSLGCRTKLTRLDFNVGLGLATSVALDHFLAENFDFLVRVDADGQHPVGEVRAMISILEGCQADVVWGERLNHMRAGSARELMATLTKQATAWAGRWIFRSRVRDWFTGFFAVNRQAARLAAQAHLERYCEVQMLCIFHACKLRIETHHIEQLERAHGKSRIRMVDGAMIVLRSTLMMALYAIRMHPK